MYDTTIACTYNILQDPDESNSAYQSELLQAFQVQKYDPTLIDATMTSLYEAMKDCPGISDVLQEVSDSRMAVFSAMFVETDEESAREMSFTCLFSYDLFHVFHPCICAHRASGCVPAESVDRLKKVILSI
jgi:hypothetical protein